MKFNRSSLMAVLAVVAVIGLSSCNRGVGCPSDFSILDPLAQIISSLF